LKGWSIPHSRGGELQENLRRLGKRESPVEEGYSSHVARAETKAIEFVRENSGIDISGHKPEDLQALDRLLGPRLRELLLRGDAGYERASLAIGSYLGEIIVRNLGGRWRFPKPVQTLVILISRDRFKADKYWFVLLDGEEVHVFRAAREAIDQTSSKSSLYEFYRQLAHGRHNRKPA
jgi:hypothetical protein